MKPHTAPRRWKAARLAATRLLCQRRGTSAIEYAFVAAMVAVIIGIFFTTIGLPISPIFNALTVGLANG